MTSNWFTRPSGARATPAICIPPPPPPPGTITSSLAIVPNIFPIGDAATISWTACNTALPLDEPVEATWEIQNITPNQQPPVANCRNSDVTYNNWDAPGTFQIKVRFRWSTGQVRSHAVAFTVTPL